MSYLGNVANQRLYFVCFDASQEIARTLGGLLTLDDEDYLSVNVATMQGPIRVEIQVRDKPPRGLDSSWPDISEISVTKAERTEARLADGYGEETQHPEIILGIRASGTFRLRVHRVGKGIADGQSPSSPEDSRMESLLISIWPEPTLRHA